jgi:hypothetical protein
MSGISNRPIRNRFPLLPTASRQQSQLTASAASHPYREAGKREAVGGGLKHTTASRKQLRCAKSLTKERLAGPPLCVERVASSEPIQ